LGRVRDYTCAVFLLLLILITFLPPAHASGQSIPINGRYSTLTIAIYIPAYPKWAHDVVLNATIAWNKAQAWYSQSNASALTYKFVETNDRTATATVSFDMPKAYAGIAVGWTDYKFARSSRTSIISTQTYLDPSIFNQGQENNLTVRWYAFWLALHELGRILGLGSVLDGQDIMEPRATPERASQIPRISTLDLYAIQVLALGATPPFVTLPSGVPNELTVATFFLP
jgi:hypothetical protein